MPDDRRDSGLFIALVLIVVLLFSYACWVMRDAREHLSEPLFVGQIREKSMGDPPSLQKFKNINKPPYNSTQFFCGQIV